MKTTKILALSALSFGALCYASCGEGAKKEKPLTAATTTTPADVSEQLAYNRAVEATIWGVPAVSMAAVRESLKRDLDANFGDIVYFSKVVEARHELLTANNQTPYVITVLDLRNGPMVLDVPAATTKTAFFGSAIDSWEVPIADIGPAGEDMGKGGKYLFLPPGYKEAAQKDYIVIPSATMFTHVALRPIPTGDGTTEDAVAYSQTLKTYPLAQAANPPANRYVDGYPKAWKTLPTYDADFMRMLAEVVEIEPAQDKDAAMLGMLASLGIEKGKPFSPSPAQTKLVAAAAGKAAEFMQYELINNVFVPFWPDRQWQAGQHADNFGFTFFGEGKLDYVKRATSFFYFATWAPKRMGDPSKLPATYYINVFKDKSGELFKGASLYRLKVPADTPVKDFWSIVVYDLTTNAFIYTEENRVGLSSYDKSTMKLNEDGSVDVFVGQKAPEGKESNWIPTNGKDFWIILRFYGPEQTLFDKKWVMPDFEKVN